MNCRLTDEMKKTIRLLEKLNSQLTKNNQVFEFEYIKRSFTSSINPFVKIDKFNKRLEKSKIENSDRFLDLFEDWLAWISSIENKAELVNRFLVDLACCSRIERG